jgi:hypothetical protein
MEQQEQVGDEIIVNSGAHQFDAGRITAITTWTEIPFAHVSLHNRDGSYSITRGIYVPLKYCQKIDAETCAEVARLSKEKRKALRAARKAAGPCLASMVAAKNFGQLDWVVQP